jgi:hypothetical protein
MKDSMVNILLTGHVDFLCRGSPEMRKFKHAVKVKDVLISHEQYTYGTAQRCNFYGPLIQRLEENYIKII